MKIGMLWKFLHISRTCLDLYELLPILLPISIYPNATPDNTLAKNNKDRLSETIAQEEGRLPRLDTERQTILERLLDLRRQLAGIDIDPSPTLENTTLSPTKRFPCSARSSGEGKMYIQNSGSARKVTEKVTCRPVPMTATTHSAGNASFPASSAASARDQVSVE